MIVFRPVVDRFVGHAGDLVAAVGERAAIVCDGGNREVGRRRPLAVEDKEARVAGGVAERGGRGRGRGGIGLRGRVEDGVALEERDGLPAVDQPQGAPGVLELNAGDELRVVQRAGRAGAEDGVEGGGVAGGVHVGNVGPERAAGVEDGDRARGGIVGRPAGGEPRADEIAGREGIRAVGVVAIIFREAAQHGFFEGLEGERAVLAAREVARGLPLELLVVIEQRAVEGQFVLHERTVHRERRAEGAVLVGAQGDLIGVFVEQRLRGSLIDDAGGRAEAEEERVRPAGDLDGLRVVGVKRHAVVRREIVDRRVGRSEAADAVRLGVGRRVTVVAKAVAGDRVLRGATVRDRGRVGAGALGAGLVFEHVVDIEGGGVVHLLLRHHGDGGGEVGEVGVEAAAGEGVFSEVTGVLRGGDLERRKLDGFFATGGIARDGCRQLRLVGLHRGELIGVEFAVFILVVFREVLRVLRGRLGARAWEREQQARRHEEDAPEHEGGFYVGVHGWS